MPEGDTIFRVAATLRSALQDKRVVEAQPASLNRLIGTTVTAVEPIGKHLVIRFDNGLALHSHMRMRGVWQVYRPGEGWRRPAWQLRAVLETADSVAVCFSAPIVELVRDVHSKVGHLGPDILADDWSASESVALARRLNETPIGEVLLDQRVVAGIGNVYRCEALWSRKINPWKPVSALDDATITGLLETAREAMRANVAGGIHRRFPGYGRGAVHGRGRRPCPRCGTPLERAVVAGRTTYFCPRDQP